MKAIKPNHSQALLDQVLEQIRKDVTDEDMTAIEELLRVVPFANLVAYLPEGKR